MAEQKDRMITSLMTSRELERSRSWTPICLMHVISKTAQD